MAPRGGKAARTGQRGKARRRRVRRTEIAPERARVADMKLLDVLGSFDDAISSGNIPEQLAPLKGIAGAYGHAGHVARLFLRGETRRMCALAKSVAVGAAPEQLVRLVAVIGVLRGLGATLERLARETPSGTSLVFAALAKGLAFKGSGKHKVLSLEESTQHNRDGVAVRGLEKRTRRAAEKELPSPLGPAIANPETRALTAAVEDMLETSRARPDVKRRAAQRLLAPRRTKT